MIMIFVMRSRMSSNQSRNPGADSPMGDRRYLRHAAEAARKCVGGLKACGIALACVGWAAHPGFAAPAKPVHRIVAIGDLHGDFIAWRAIARAAGLIDAQGHWTGGDTVLVQDGDVIDRGPDSMAIVHDLMRLEGEAARAHGRVIALVGNHEAMNMTGDLRYVPASEFVAYADSESARRREAVFAANESTIDANYRRRDPSLTKEAIHKAWIAATPLGWVEHEADWSPDGRVGRWVIGHSAAVMLDGTIFVHGGIGLGYACLPLAEINRRVAAALKARDMSPQSIINDPVGPLWYRGLVIRDASDPASSPPGSGPCGAPSPYPSMEQELDQVLARYGARRMVVAHTPVLSGIAVLDQGRLVRIDTGISSVFGGKLSYLEIVDGVLQPHEVARPPPSPGGGRP
jgi:hypothetical protein